MFATMRRKRRNNRMKSELGQSVDHFKRAATLAAQETSATVGPKINAAVDRVQPAAVKAKETAGAGWESAVATLAPIVAAATENVRHAQAEGRKQVKVGKKKAKKLEKRANKALGRQQHRGRTGKLVGLALIGAAVGVGAAYVLKRRQAAQWDEYDPSEPIVSSHAGADDAAFEPSDSDTTTHVTKD